MTLTPSSLKAYNNRGGAGEIETFAMANCLMLLSSQETAAAAAAAAAGENPATGAESSPAVNDLNRLFTCKTCGRSFSSFQALGGHRASHKKIRQENSGEAAAGGKEYPAPAKSKSHACSICGQEFPIGQALGGHMRRHRNAVVSGISTTTTNTEGSNDNKSDLNSERKRKIDDDNDVLIAAAPIVKNYSSTKRVCLDDVDLNLSLSLWRENREEVVDADDDYEVEEGEIVEQAEGVKIEQVEEEKDFLKLELRQPIRSW